MYPFFSGDLEVMTRPTFMASFENSHISEGAGLILIYPSAS